MTKKSKSTKSKNTTESNAGTSIEHLSDQLNDVTVQVLHNIMKMDSLHEQWINYLFVLSNVVILLSFYQIYSIFATNHNDIGHTFNHSAPSSMFIQKLPKPLHIFLQIDSSIITYIISTFMSLFLFLFITVVKRRLQEQQPLTNSLTGIFRHFYFRMTQLCSLPTMILYYNQLKKLDQSTIPSASASSVQHHQFPVVIIYFVVVSICIWFMQYQSIRMHRSYNAIVRLRSEFMQKQQHSSNGGKDKKKK
jgi:hypothetical protein